MKPILNKDTAQLAASAAIREQNQPVVDMLQEPTEAACPTSNLGPSAFRELCRKYVRQEKPPKRQLHSYQLEED